ncbi:hypothetical protein O181_018712 [Austropuccinia psidii MF-1]|uniref:Uncharacterized protein n=1 Tax=Austropuccinia psidii MF-1 TaxID=1389203 RepID=A0A9Q3CA40_9BASI|nr:hypothetical protein [Austropuccinia psidii MF-1]
MTPIGTIIKEIVLPHRKGNIRLTPELVVLEDAHNQVLLVGTEYQRMHGINIYNRKNRNIAIGTRKEKKSSLDIYQFANKDPLEELIHELKEGQFNTNLTSKNKLSKLKTLERNGPSFSIGREPLGEIRGCHIELYLDVKKFDELLDMDFIRKIGHNEIVEVTKLCLITYHNRNSRLFGDLRALKKLQQICEVPYTKDTHVLGKMAKAK